MVFRATSRRPPGRVMLLVAQVAGHLPVSHTFPQVNERRNEPSVNTARTPPNSAGIAPCPQRMSSILSAPPIIPGAKIRGSSLDRATVGHVALIGTSTAVSSGLARTAADPPKLAMGPAVMVNVASVGKMFQDDCCFEVAGPAPSQHRQPDLAFLPPDWVKGPGVDTITIGELLTRRAGFRLDSGLVFETATRFSSPMCSVRYSTRWASSTPPARQSTMPSSCTRRLVAGRTGQAGPMGHRCARLAAGL